MNTSLINAFCKKKHIYWLKIVLEICGVDIQQAVKSNKESKQRWMKHNTRSGSSNILVTSTESIAQKWGNQGKHLCCEERSPWDDCFAAQTTHLGKLIDSAIMTKLPL